jgi:two-component system cell cycle sensor histidine kinase/response regulator CckA
MNTSPASTNVSSCQTDQTESTILLVEDEPVVREVTRAVLEHAGYRVLACDGPDEALRVGSEHRENIGLLLTDVVMPGMNGAELAERLQRLRAGLITVFMSGYAERHVLHEVLHDDRTNYIQKPFTINILLSRVAAALRKRAEVGEAALYVSAR